LDNDIGYPLNMTAATSLDKSLEAARTKKSRTNIRSLIMYSGGLDSVALLASAKLENRVPSWMHDEN